jgi:hypothetical protein
MIMQDNETPNAAATKRAPWNKGKLIGAKPPLRPKHVWFAQTFGVSCGDAPGARRRWTSAEKRRLRAMAGLGSFGNGAAPGLSGGQLFVWRRLGRQGGLAMSRRL